MSNNEITSVLTILLIISVIVLAILIGAFIIIWMKKKAENKQTEEELNNQNKEVSTVNSNVIQAKTYTAQNVKNFLDFEEIKDNMIIQDKGKRLVMVIQCQGINYDLMSSIEKTSVEQGFVQFLNTLTRPIQIYIQSRKVNLEESLQNYKKRLKDIENKFNKTRLQYEQAKKNIDLTTEQFNMIKLEYVRQKNLYDYTKDIISNTEKMSFNKNILTKNYYIAISYVPDNTENLFEKEELLDIAFSELYTNAQSLLRILAVCGITGKVLDSTELADLLYVAYNRDASEIFGVDKAIRAGYDSLYTTAPDVIDKKMAEIDKIINEKALELANNTIEEVTINSKRKKALEEKENNMQELVKNLAKMMIRENEDYIGKEIAEESITAIDENKKEKKTQKKKGA